MLLLLAYCHTHTLVYTHTHTHSLPQCNMENWKLPKRLQMPLSLDAHHSSGPCQIHVAEPRSLLSFLSHTCLPAMHQPSYLVLEKYLKSTHCLPSGLPTPGHHCHLTWNELPAPTAPSPAHKPAGGPQMHPNVHRRTPGLTHGALPPFQAPREPLTHGLPHPRPPPGPQTLPSLVAFACSVPSVWDTSTFVHFPSPNPSSCRCSA